MGARSDDWPAEDKDIRPYSAEVLPGVFKEAASCPVRVLSAERTFWEKATLLHAETHRPTASAPKERYSRHYYDLYMLAGQDISGKALQQPELLKRVIAHKKLFFASAWSSFDTAVPGSFRLLPAKERLNSLELDYSRMAGMIFGEKPPWSKIISGLRKLEEHINRMRFV